ncbi:hypothetical protein ACCS71_14230 [Rhizobium ruizarguesonis]
MTTTFSNQQVDAMRKYAYCENRSAQKSDSVDIGIKVFSLGVDSKTAKDSRVCENEYNSLDISDVDFQSAKQVFDESLATIDQCLILAAQQWDVKFTPYARDAFAVGISHRGGNGDFLKRAKIFPTGSLTCEGIPTGEQKVTTTETVTIECERKPNRQMVAGVEVISADAATLSLFLGTMPLPITLPAYGGSVLDQINDKIGKLTEAHSALKGAFDEKMNQISSGAGVHETRRASTSWQECPAGFYVSAIRGVDTDNGGACTSCISQVEFRCQKIGE